jgi:phosphoribosylamine--glycine ligase
VVVHDVAEAQAARGRFGWPAVLKADGLAAGKGVIIARDEAEYDAAVREMLEERRFGRAADRVVVEAFLEGEEVSLMALCDGERVLPLATVKDYKQAGDGDTGPNTGGMGSHSPAGVLSAETAAAIFDTILHTAVAGMAAEGRPFIGILYAGLILTREGPRVLEFNARLGDPEAQALLLRLEDDLLPVLAAGAAGNFGARRLSFRKEAAACIVLASPGYPERPVSGDVIQGLDRAAALPGIEIFHAGTAWADGELVSAGGRVLSVCALDADLLGALRRAYAAVAEIDWPAKVFRHDIGRRLVGP